MTEDHQRRLLGEFIRAHRERLRPDGPAGRRRTPGLRREELADRAGISTTWCTWIEQGRAVRASPEALGRLARALALTRAERAYLFELAGRRDPEAGPPEPAADAPPALQAAMAALTVPAYGLDRFWTACCWNEPAARLFRGWLDDGWRDQGASPGGGPRNLLRFVFLSPAARLLLPSWQDRARRVLAEFRADYGQGVRDPRMGALVDDLRRASPLFARAWEEQDVLDRAGGLRAFCQPSGDVLHFQQHTLVPSDRPDYKLVILTPD